MSIERVEKKVHPIVPINPSKDAEQQSRENADAQRQLPKAMQTIVKKKSQPKIPSKDEERPKEPPKTTGDGHIDVKA